MPKGKRINSTVKKIICNVYNYFENESKKFLMLNKLLQILKEKEQFFGGHTILLKKIRLSYKKVNNKHYVYEQPKITLKWHQKNEKKQKRE